MAAGQREIEVLEGRDEDDSAFAELMRLQIVTRYFCPLDEADLADILRQLSAQLRDARTLRAVALANSDEPAFTLAVTGPEP